MGLFSILRSTETHRFAQIRTDSQRLGATRSDSKRLAATARLTETRNYFCFVNIFGVATVYSSRDFSARIASDAIVSCRNFSESSVRELMNV